MGANSSKRSKSKDESLCTKRQNTLSTESSQSKTSKDKTQTWPRRLVRRLSSRRKNADTLDRKSSQIEKSAAISNSLELECIASSVPEAEFNPSRVALRSSNSLTEKDAINVPSRLSASIVHGTSTVVRPGINERRHGRDVSPQYSSIDVSVSTSRRRSYIIPAHIIPAPLNLSVQECPDASSKEPVVHVNSLPISRSNPASIDDSIKVEKMPLPTIDISPIFDGNDSEQMKVIDMPSNYHSFVDSMNNSHALNSTLSESDTNSVKENGDSRMSKTLDDIADISNIAPGAPFSRGGSETTCDTTRRRSQSFPNRFDNSFSEEEIHNTQISSVGDDPVSNLKRRYSNTSLRSNSSWITNVEPDRTRGWTYKKKHDDDDSVKTNTASSTRLRLGIFRNLSASPSYEGEKTNEYFITVKKTPSLPLKTSSVTSDTSDVYPDFPANPFSFLPESQSPPNTDTLAPSKNSSPTSETASVHAKNSCSPHAHNAEVTTTQRETDCCSDHSSHSHSGANECLRRNSSWIANTETEFVRGWSGRNVSRRRASRTKSPRHSFRRRLLYRSLPKRHVPIQSDISKIVRRSLPHSNNKRSRRRRVNFAYINIKNSDDSISLEDETGCVISASSGRASSEETLTSSLVDVRGTALSAPEQDEKLSSDGLCALAAESESNAPLVMRGGAQQTCSTQRLEDIGRHEHSHCSLTRTNLSGYHTKKPDCNSEEDDIAIRGTERSKIQHESSKPVHASSSKLIRMNGINSTIIPRDIVRYTNEGGGNHAKSEVRSSGYPRSQDNRPTDLQSTSDSLKLGSSVKEKSPNHVQQLSSGSKKSGEAVPPPPRSDVYTAGGERRSLDHQFNDLNGGRSVESDIQNLELTFRKINNTKEVRESEREQNFGDGASEHNANEITTNGVVKVSLSENSKATGRSTLAQNKIKAKLNNNTNAKDQTYLSDESHVQSCVKLSVSGDEEERHANTVLSSAATKPSPDTSNGKSPDISKPSITIDMNSTLSDGTHSALLHTSSTLSAGSNSLCFDHGELTVVLVSFILIMSIIFETTIDHVKNISSNIVK